MMEWFAPREIVLSECMEPYTECDNILKSTKKQVLDEGDSIIRRAGKESELILARANVEAKGILEKAEEKFRQGFAKGEKEGRQAALQNAVIWLAELSEMKNAVFRELKHKMTGTIEHILQRVFAEHGQQWLKSELEASLSSIIIEETIQVYVSESVTGLACVMKPQQARGLKIQIVPDGNMDENRCLIRTRYFEMELSLDNVYQQVMNTFLTAFNEIQLRNDIDKVSE